METEWLRLNAAGGGSPLLSYLFLAVVTASASAINSVAGGGTILTFPALAAILPHGPTQLVIANVTSKIGLWPGALAAAWEYRHERRDQPPWAVWLLLPSLLGSLLGTALIMVLPPSLFERLVPWLILVAAVLFAIQPRLSGWLAVRGKSPPGSLPANADDRSPTWATPEHAEGFQGCQSQHPAAADDFHVHGQPGRPSQGLLLLAAGLQFAVAIYGGYFGAGIGILMLAVLGSLELGDIHLLNGVKNVLGMAINAAATLLFALGSLFGWTEVAWPEAAVMAVAAVAGGLAGGRLARRCSPRAIRRLVAVIGFALAGYHLLS